MISASTRKAPTMASYSSVSSFQKRRIVSNASKKFYLKHVSSSSSGDTQSPSKPIVYQHRCYTQNAQHQISSQGRFYKNHILSQSPLQKSIRTIQQQQRHSYGSLSAKVAEIAAAAAASFTDTESTNNTKHDSEKNDKLEALQELLEDPTLFSAQLESFASTGSASKQSARTAESLLRLVVDAYLNELSSSSRKKISKDEEVVIIKDDGPKLLSSMMDVLPHLPPRIEEKMKRYRNSRGSVGAFSSQNFNASIRKRRDVTRNTLVNVEVQPTADLFFKCIEAWRKSGSKVAPDRAEDLLIALCDLYNLTGRDDESLRPTTEIFNAVMDCWPNSNRGVEAAVRCEQFLHYMIATSFDNGTVVVKPDTASFGIVLDCWAKASYLERGKDGHECAKRSEEILEWIELLRQSSSFSDDNRDGYYSNVQPNADCFASVINAWAYRCTHTSAIRAMRIFDLMLDIYSATGDKRMKPTTRAYYAVLSAWARSGSKNSAEKAEDILRHMDTLTCDVADDDGDDDVVRPNVHCFNAAIMAHAHSRGGVESARRAESLLDWMEELYRNGDEGAKPNTRSYRLVMSAWAWSRSHDAPLRTESILERMMDANKAGNIHIIPSSSDFNTVISCCAYVKQLSSNGLETKSDAETALLGVTERGEGDPLRVAFSTLDALGEFPHSSANSTTFATLIKACAAHLPPGAERNLWVQELFQTCSDLGLVDQRVLSQLRRAVPKDHYISLREEHENFRLSSKPTAEEYLMETHDEERIKEEEDDDMIELEDEMEDEFVMVERDY
mmetsp:Transcript_36613/g.56024  ORF Transcript_36613/g.56024 Transcript_36613/m.56024 type:complete len:785 (+) Transcript_36613:3-2357(+)